MLTNNKYVNQTVPIENLNANFIFLAEEIEDISASCNELTKNKRRLFKTQTCQTLNLLVFFESSVLHEWYSVNNYLKNDHYKSIVSSYCTNNGFVCLG